MKNLREDLIIDESFILTPKMLADMANATGNSWPNRPNPTFKWFTKNGIEETDESYAVTVTLKKGVNY